MSDYSGNNAEIVQSIYSLVMDSPLTHLKSFKKGDILVNFLENRNTLYFLLLGEASLLRLTPFGEELVMEKYEMYDCFGEYFFNVRLNSEYSVVATKSGSLFYLDLEELKQEKKLYPVFPLLMELFQSRIWLSNERIEILSNRSTRLKLLTYFRYHAQLSQTLTLDLNYTELADYLLVNRSSLMRELTLLEEEGFLTRNKKRITLLLNG